MQSRNAALMVLLATALSGCSGTAAYREVSAEYPQLLGRSIRATEPQFLHAVATVNYPKNVVDKYVITRRPGFGGPEVIFRRELPAGMKLRIIRVEHCTNCWFGFEDRPHAVVSPPSAEYSDHPVTVDLERDGNDLKVPGFTLDDQSGTSVTE